MRFVFVMDPVELVLPDEDTSFALMLAAQTRGHEVSHCLASDVDLARGQVMATTRTATMTRSQAPPVILGAGSRIPLAEVDAVFVRKDPPFDDVYLWLTLVLEHLRGTTLVVNDPRGLREANEKLYAAHFPDLVPPTLVSASSTAIGEFVDEVGGRAVIKPVDGHGGEGVFSLARSDPNYNALVETATRGGMRATMVQQYLPEVSRGDKRVLLLDGEPLGAILRVPQRGDLRSNIHVGGNVEPAQLDAADERIVATMASRLRQDGLRFVGLDVIGGWLTEVNVTSPTGIQQMSRFDRKDYASEVIEWVERAV